MLWEMGVACQCLNTTKIYSVACFGAPSYNNFPQSIASKYDLDENSSDMYVQPEHILLPQNYVVHQRQFEAYGSNSHQSHRANTKKIMAKAAREGQRQQKPRHHSKMLLMVRRKLHNKSNNGKFEAC